MFCIIFKSTCITFADSYIGFGISKFRASTLLYRMFKLRYTFRVLDPCHVYITLPALTHSSVFINIQIEGESSIGNSTLFYDEESYSSLNGYLRNQVKNLYEFTLGGNAGSRKIYSFLLDDLSSNMSHRFIFSLNGQNYTRCPDNGFDFKFSTLPDHNSIIHNQNYSTDSKSGISIDSNINLIVAGNVGITTKLIRQFQLMNSLEDINKLDALILGGNIAKDNGCESCKFLWDELMVQFSSLFTNVGRIVPIM